MDDYYDISCTTKTSIGGFDGSGEVEANIDANIDINTKIDI